MTTQVVLFDLGGVLVELGRFDDASIALGKAAQFGMSDKQVQSVRKRLEARKAGA